LSTLFFAQLLLLLLLFEALGDCRDIARRLDRELGCDGADARKR
jgi:hypothetical protein